MENRKKSKIGLLGGTFNPVHHGHLALARAALDAHALDAVWFIPCGCPVHKSAEALAPASHRIAMLELAILGHPRFAVSRVETDREGKSFTVETVESLRKEYPDAEWYFIIGSDTLPELASWHRIEDLLASCRIIAMQRPGVPVGDALENMIVLPDPWPQRLVADMFSGHLMDIASSTIRKKVAQRCQINNLVPEKVAEYIQRNNLYLEE